MTIFNSLRKLWRGPEAPVSAPLAQTVPDLHFDPRAVEVRRYYSPEPRYIPYEQPESDAAKARAFLDGLRAENRSGSATFGNITAGRAVFPSPPQQVPKKTPRAPIVADGNLDGKDLLKFMK